MSSNNLSSVIGKDGGPFALVRNAAVALTIVLGLLEISGRVGFLPSGVLEPSAVGTRLWQLARYGEDASGLGDWMYLHEHFLVSIWNVSGVFVGAPVGFLLAVVLAVYPPLRYFAWVLAGASFGAPTVAFFLATLPWFSTIEPVKFLTSAWIGFSLELIVVYTSMHLMLYGQNRQEDTTRLFWRIQAMRPKRHRLIRRHLVRMLGPEFFGALAVAGIYSWHMLAYSEGFGQNFGVGSLVAAGSQEVDFPLLWAGTISVIGGSLVYYGLLLAIKQRLDRRFRTMK